MGIWTLCRLQVGFVCAAARYARLRAESLQEVAGQLFAARLPGQIADAVALCVCVEKKRGFVRG